MQKRNRKRNAGRARAGARLKAALSAYFAAHILLTGAFALGVGAYLTRRGSEGMLSGAAENCITMEDLNKRLADLRGRLSYYINNSKLSEFFENIY